MYEYMEKISLVIQSESKSENGCILSYDTGGNYMIEVPKELIPFWAECGEFLCYENGEFNRVF